MVAVHGTPTHPTAESGEDAALQNGTEMGLAIGVA